MEATTIKEENTTFRVSRRVGAKIMLYTFKVHARTFLQSKSFCIAIDRFLSFV